MKKRNRVIARTAAFTAAAAMIVLLSTQVASARPLAALGGQVIAGTETLGSEAIAAFVARALPSSLMAMTSLLRSAGPALLQVQDSPPPAAHNQFGLVIASCEHADLRPLPTGVMIYGDRGEQFDALPAPAVPRAEVIDEWCDAIAGVRAPVHSGEWGRATLEACLAILQSSREGREIALHRQTAAA